MGGINDVEPQALGLKPVAEPLLIRRKLFADSLELDP
jgi:hypothetical protein